MIAVQLQDGSHFEARIALLRKMVLARAFPDLDEDQRLNKITVIFESPQTLDRLCPVSGGTSETCGGCSIPGLEQVF